MFIRSEREVQAALDQLVMKPTGSGGTPMVSAERTTLVIAHRLSTVMNVDRVVVMSKGSVVEMGSPTELKDKGTILTRGSVVSPCCCFVW